MFQNDRLPAETGEKGVHIMEQRKDPRRRILVFLTVLMILPLLVLRDGHPEHAGTSQKKIPFAASYTRSHADMLLSAVLHPEEDDLSAAVRLTKGHPSGKRSRFERLHDLLLCTAGLLSFGCYAFLFFCFAYTETGFSRRYILKYIHDQDGRKGTDSDSLKSKSVQNELGGIFHGHRQNMYDRFLCALYCGDDLCGDSGISR